MAGKYGATKTSRSHKNGHNAESHENNPGVHIPESGADVKYDLKKLRPTPYKLINWLGGPETTPVPIYHRGNADRRRKAEYGQTYMELPNMCIRKTTQ